ncbi:MAG: hypothetical protein ABWX56_07980, partial [Mycetocola sp.]
YLIALWAALTLNFIIPRLMPGNPVDILLAKLQQRGGTVDASTRQAYELLPGHDHFPVGFSALKISALSGACQIAGKA